MQYKRLSEMEEKMNQQNSNLKIYQKYMELIYYTNDLVRKYPKSETFALVEEIKLIHFIKSPIKNRELFPNQ